MWWRVAGVVNRQKGVLREHSVCVSGPRRGIRISRVMAQDSEEKVYSIAARKPRSVKRNFVNFTVGGAKSCLFMNIAHSSERSFASGIPNNPSHQRIYIPLLACVCACDCGGNLPPKVSYTSANIRV